VPALRAGLSPSPQGERPWLCTAGSPAVRPDRNPVAGHPCRVPRAAFGPQPPLGGSPAGRRPAPHLGCSTDNPTMAGRAIPGFRDEPGGTARPKIPTARALHPHRTRAGRARHRQQPAGDPADRTPDDPPSSHLPDRARRRAVGPGRQDHGGEPAGLRAGRGRRPHDRRRTGPVPPGRRDQRAERRCVDRQHQPHPRPVHRGRGVPHPAAPDGGGGRAVQRVVPALRHDTGGLPGHAGRGPATGRDDQRERRVLVRAGRGGRPGPAGRGRHAAAAVPGPDDEDLPGRADVVPAVAAGPGRHHTAAPDAGDRPGRARGHRRLPRAGALRQRPRIP
jgi:hypothetical protein